MESLCGALLEVEFPVDGLDMSRIAARQPIMGKTSSKMSIRRSWVNGIRGLEQVRLARFHVESGESPATVQLKSS